MEVTEGLEQVSGVKHFGQRNNPSAKAHGGGKDNVFQEQQGVGEAGVGSAVGDQDRESNGADDGCPSRVSSREFTR